ncbi:hypothetical protein AAG570_005594 [Ranatra chinensis]|uniref:Uncharacterized protein n=1 Tax=Ranatra chinensis TaxID=642074 RepID=A0ABD0YJM2_9HEMI
MFSENKKQETTVIGKWDTGSRREACKWAEGGNCKGVGSQVGEMGCWSRGCETIHLTGYNNSSPPSSSASSIGEEGTRSGIDNPAMEDHLKNDRYNGYLTPPLPDVRLKSLEGRQKARTNFRRLLLLVLVKRHLWFNNQCLSLNVR